MPESVKVLSPHYFVLLNVLRLFYKFPVVSLPEFAMTHRVEKEKLLRRQVIKAKGTHWENKLPPA